MEWVNTKNGSTCPLCNEPIAEGEATLVDPNAEKPEAMEGMDMDQKPDDMEGM